MSHINVYKRDFQGKKQVFPGKTAQRPKSLKILVFNGNSASASNELKQ